MSTPKKQKRGAKFAEVVSANTRIKCSYKAKDQMIKLIDRTIISIAVLCTKEDYMEALTRLRKYVQLRIDEAEKECPGLLETLRKITPAEEKLPMWRP